LLIKMCGTLCPTVVSQPAFSLYLIARHLVGHRSVIPRLGEAPGANPAIVA
jgi:hypothetical protein